MEKIKKIKKRKVKPYRISLEAPNHRKCDGAAHSPDMAGGVDNCSLCAPFWEDVLTCPNCGRKISIFSVEGSPDVLRCVPCLIEYPYTEYPKQEIENV